MACVCMVAGGSLALSHQASSLYFILHSKSCRTTGACEQHLVEAVVLVSALEVGAKRAGAVPGVHPRTAAALP
eukprot:5955958-Amphidinium_carterae.2